MCVILSSGALEKNFHVPLFYADPGKSQFSELHKFLILELGAFNPIGLSLHTSRCIPNQTARGQ